MAPRRAILANIYRTLPIDRGRYYWISCWPNLRASTPGMGEKNNHKHPPCRDNYRYTGIWEIDNTPAMSTNLRQH